MLLCIPLEKDPLPHILELLDQLNLRLLTQNRNVVSEGTGCTVAQLHTALEKMNNLVIHDDRIECQREEFEAEWTNLRSIIEQAEETWCLNHMHAIELIYQRAHDISRIFEREIERTLLQEPPAESKGTSTSDITWGELCAETLYENISDWEEKPEEEQKNANSVQIEHVDLTEDVQIDNGQGQSAPVDSMSFEETQTDEVHSNTEQQTDSLKSIQSAPSDPIANQELPAGSSVDSQVTKEIPQQMMTTSTAGIAPAGQFMSNIPMNLVRPGEFTLRNLFMYNRAMNELNGMPTFSKPPLASEFRAVREFITKYTRVV